MKYSKELVTELYQELLSVRMAEEKLVEIYALGKVPGHIHSGVGEEAAYVAPLMTRREHFVLCLRPCKLCNRREWKRRRRPADGLTGAAL